MFAALLCLGSLILTFFCGRRSLGKGLVAVFAVGYGYGILRANFPDTASHFIFDSAAIGLYAAAFLTPTDRATHFLSLTLQPWVAVLIAWPILMFFVPQQDWMIQLVGLRGALFFLPFLLIGARMKESDLHCMAKGLAVLNLVVFGFALYEFFFGLEKLFPRNPVTDLIYKTSDVAGGSYRIPSTFVASAAYGSVMALTVPFLAGVWARPNLGLPFKRLLEAGLVASGIGVFLSASRTSALLLGCSLVVIFAGIQVKTSKRVGLIALIILLGFIVRSDERLQRFTTLTDLEMVQSRIVGSVNMSFFDLLLAYPMGNGLGAGGTSIPYFLQSRLQNPVVLENEYSRIMLEQGVLGLFLWVVFAFWLIFSGWPGRSRNWYLARRLLWCGITFSFVGGVLGLGMLTAIPGTGLLLLGSGWLIARRREEMATAKVQTAPAVDRVRPPWPVRRVVQ